MDIVSVSNVRYIFVPDFVVEFSGLTIKVHVVCVYTYLLIPALHVYFFLVIFAFIMEEKCRYF
jgi:hypothetical protein